MKTITFPSYIILLCLIGLHMTTPLSASSCSVDKKSLEDNITTILTRPEISRASFGIAIYAKQSSDHYVPLYLHNNRALMYPASNTKIFTTASAFLKYGMDYTVKTMASVNDRGDMCIIGRGDATMGYDTLRLFAKRIVESGERPGVVYYDDPFPVFPDSWEFGDLLYDYAALPTSFVLEENTARLQLVVDDGAVRVSFNNEHDQTCIKYDNTIRLSKTEPTSVSVKYKLGSDVLFLEGVLNIKDASVSEVFAVRNPSERFMCVLNEYIKEHGIHNISFTPRHCDQNEFSRSVAQIESPPFSASINHTMQISDNLYAENFLRMLGSEKNGDFAQNGLEIVRQVLNDLGVDPSSYLQRDGSGLSRQNLFSNDAIFEILRALEKVPDFAQYKSCFPLGGRTGSIRNRFIGTLGEGRIYAKTGSATGVNSLSGYIDYGPGFIFSILTNGGTISNSDMRKVIDEITLLPLELCH
eukprot:TRINITY_DN2519_c0_g1_i1.p1 TRINITY_DN2519_c0_g1~~TRINITY_DN2519_c0_g1_i1.p1  ORF type:complete len:477 (+),score=79.47 TRINITY_DN2519_c0_g1_i1:24-1433(+)